LRKEAATMNNQYEAPEVVEIGKAQDIILGVKDQNLQDNIGSTPASKFPPSMMVDVED
jgi:hypothetical protein